MHHHECDRGWALLSSSLVHNASRALRRTLQLAVLAVALFATNAAWAADDESAQAQPAEKKNEQRQDAPKRDAAPPSRGQAPVRQQAAGAQPAGAQPGQPGAQPPVPTQRDNVKDLLAQLDPSMLQLSGADLNFEIVGGQVVIVGTEQDVKVVESIMRLLDDAGPRKQIRVVQVDNKDAKEISQQLQSAIREREKYRPSDDQTTLSAVGSNIVLVSALPDDIDFIETLIHDVDLIPDAIQNLESQLLVFQIKYRKASEVSTLMKDFLKKLQDKRGAKEITVTPNNINNTITVIAPETDRPKIQAILDTLDVEPTEAGGGKSELVLFPLMHSKATELAETLDKLIKEETTGDNSAETKTINQLILKRVSPDGTIREMSPLDLGKEIRIIPDDGTQSLIVATVQKNIEPLGELIRILDGVPLAANLDVKLFSLKFADATQLSETIKQMFDDAKGLPPDPDGSGEDGVPDAGPGRALVYEITLSPDARTNTLVASGRQDQLQLVEKIVSDLDKPATALKFPLKLIPIQNSDATRIAVLLRKLIDQREESADSTEVSGSALVREKVFLSTDVAGNALLVSASPENLDEIVSIVKQLDTQPAKGHEQIHILPCKRLSVKDLKEKIDELWARKAALVGWDEQLDDPPVIAIDERSNSLVVAASPDDFSEIKRVVEVLESQPLLSDTQIFKLNYVDANVLTDMLDKIFEGFAAGSESFVKPTVVPDQRSNTIVVAGSQDSMERVDYLVKRLDVEAGPTTAIFKVYPLRHGSSTKLASRMQQLFDSRKEGEEGTRTPIAILADEASNSLIASASRDDHDVIVDLIGLMDRPSNIARQFEIFPLKFAKAAVVAEKLSTIFASQGEGASGRVDAVAAEADERTNSLIVWASPSEMANIGEVIQKLDTDRIVVEMGVKIIQLKQALAEDFATLLTETILGENSGGDDERAVIVSFPWKRPDGTIEHRKMLRQDIKVQADRRTNSLMVMAPADSMSMLESMIEDFDRVRPIKSEVRLFPLINSDATTMVEKLNELFKTEEGGGGGEDTVKSQLVFGDLPAEFDIASVGQDLRFSADERTNTLIAAGAEIDLRMVEELVRWLDAQEAEPRLNEVIQVAYNPAEKIASAIKSFVDQEQAVLGEAVDQESIRARAERQISVESLSNEGTGDGGGSSGGSSSLILGVAPRRYQETMDLIRKLDRPEPQVRISVLIAEVTLTDNVELGMEIAGRDLDFSDSAVLGPNGVIQGPDFDWISGTDLGAAGLGLGGFNFTVTGEDFSFLLHAVQQDSRLEILSRPVLLVRNGEEGKISIADQVPFVESSQINDTGSTNSTISSEEVGIILTATPHISPDGYVTIELNQKVSNFSGENIQLTEGVSSPIISEREVDTNVTVRDGETVVVGGLITSRESESENKVPLLGDIPILGQLARANFVTTQKTELLMVLSVDILRTDEDLKKMSVEERDRFVMPDTIRQSPLMEGLRIRPEEVGMGPRPANSTTPMSPTTPPPARGNERDLYGPRPKTYGPTITPKSASTSTARGPASYGPKVVRNDATEPQQTAPLHEIAEIEAAAIIEPQ